MSRGVESPRSLGGLETEEEDSYRRLHVRRKLDLNLLPWLFSLGVVCYLDRTNLSFAAVQLNRDLHLSCFSYGLGAGLFFVSYASFQVPSTMIQARVGAPIWLGLTIVVWGIVAASFAAVRSQGVFVLLRVLLGLAESGTFPGVWQHLSRFYSPRELGAAYSFVSTSTALAQIIGAPIAAVILATLDGSLGLAGWQWLFLIEGVCTVLYGVCLRYCLAKSPEEASFLDDDEKIWLQERQERFQHTKSSAFSVQATHVRSVFKDWRIWYLSIVLFSITQAMYGCVFFIPMIIHTFFYGADDDDGGGGGTGGESSACGGGEGAGKGGAVVALLSMIPFASAAVCMVCYSSIAFVCVQTSRYEDREVSHVLRTCRYLWGNSQKLQMKEDSMQGYLYV